jgi:membrane protease YdiL (CAAX protease family)
VEPAPSAPPAPPASSASPPLPVEPALPATPAPHNGGLQVMRALLAAAALGLLAYGGLALAPNLGHLQASNIAGLAARLALAGSFLWVAWRPHDAARAVRAPALATPSGLAGFALVALALYVLFGLGTAVETAQLLQRAAAGESPSEAFGDIDRTALFATLLINFAVFTIPALAWAAGTEGQRGGRALAWLRLKGGNLRWSLGWALTGVTLVFWFLIAAGIAARFLGQGEVSNERAEAIARALDIPTALLVAAITGIGEELFFRGFLLRKVGNVPQAVLFGLAHLNYLQWLEVAVTAFIGYAFGRTAQRTGSIVGPIVGHAAFNALSLIIVILKSNGTLG